MENVLKKRMVGTAVIVALAVIFVPMLLEGPKQEAKEVSMQISIPDRPAYDIPNRLATAEPANEPVSGEGASTEQINTIASATVAEVPVVNKAEPAVEVAVVKSEEKVQVKAEPPVKQAEAKVVEVLASSKSDMATPAEKSPAKQIPTETSSAGFVIQVGSFSNGNNAESLKSRLVSAGYPAFVDASQVKGKDIFRVKVGPKPSRKLANQLRIELIDEEKLEGIIVRHP